MTSHRLSSAFVGLFRPVPLRALSIPNTAGVETATPGLTRTAGIRGNGGNWLRISPRPSTQQDFDSRQTGTSDPSSAANLTSCSWDELRPHNLSRPRNAAAASAEPPPIPDATGKFLVSRIVAPSARRDRCRNARGRLSEPDCHRSPAARAQMDLSPRVTALPMAKSPVRSPASVKPRSGFAVREKPSSRRSPT